MKRFRIHESTLSDGSTVYDVSFGELGDWALVAHAASETHAEAIRNSLNRVLDALLDASSDRQSAEIENAIAIALEK